MKKLLFLSLFGISLITCEKNNSSISVPVDFTKNYISRFVDCEDINVSSGEYYLSSMFDTEMPKLLIQALPKKDTVLNIHNLYNCWNGFYFDNNILLSGNSYDDGRYPDDVYYTNKRQIYYSYINQIGDTCFNRILPGGHSPISDAITVPLRTISITCDKDFSPEFPAGAELSSLFHVVFDDFYATIKNGYKTAEGSFSPPNDTPNWKYYVNHSYFKEKLSEVNFPERPFIGNEWLCILDVVPNKTAEYTFHVKVTLVNGNEMEKTSPPIEIKGKVD